MSLSAGFFSVQKKPDDQSVDVKMLFKKSVEDVNAMIKRGDYDREQPFHQNMSHIIYILDAKKNSVIQVDSLLVDLKNYSDIVSRTLIELSKQAPQLQKNRRVVLSELEFFNKKLRSIGLGALSEAWRELSQLKRDFVRMPSANLKKEFDTKFSYVHLLITELYLDEEMEEPLFAYLKRYKDVFDVMAHAYKDVGYERVASLKTLSYKIKADLEFLPLAL
jgi:hypothetical protein